MLSTCSGMIPCHHKSSQLNSMYNVYNKVYMYKYMNTLCIYNDGMFLFVSFALRRLYPMELYSIIGQE